MLAILMFKYWVIIYVTTIAIHFPSTRLTCETLKCKEHRVYLMLHAPANRGETFPALSFNMVDKNLILTATCWTKPIDFASWQNGEAANAAQLAFIRDGPSKEGHQL